MFALFCPYALADNNHIKYNRGKMAERRIRAPLSASKSGARKVWNSWLRINCKASHVNSKNNFPTPTVQWPAPFCFSSLFRQRVNPSIPTFDVERCQLIFNVTSAPSVSGFQTMRWESNANVQVVARCLVSCVTQVRHLQNQAWRRLYESLVRSVQMNSYSTGA